MSGYATCQACSRTHFECVCSKACGLCGIVSNHTTAQHELAARVMCQRCDAAEVQEDDRLCAECAQEEGEYLSELASYYVPDEGGENG